MSLGDRTIVNWTPRALLRICRRRHLAPMPRCGSRPVVSGLDGLDGLPQPSHAFAEEREHDPDDPPLDVLAVAHNDDVDVGCPVGPAREGVGTPEAPPQVLESVVVMTTRLGSDQSLRELFPDTARALRDVGVGRALVMDLEVVIGAAAKQFERPGPEVGERGE